MTPERLSDGEVQARKLDLAKWTLEGPELHRRFELANFRAVLAFTNRVGMLAEEEQHHPDFHITDYKHLELVLTTHDAGGLTLGDFAMAKKIDALAAKDGLA